MIPVFLMSASPLATPIATWPASTLIVPELLSVAEPSLTSINTPTPEPLAVMVPELLIVAAPVCDCTNMPAVPPETNLPASRSIWIEPLLVDAATP